LRIDDCELWIPLDRPIPNPKSEIRHRGPTGRPDWLRFFATTPISRPENPTLGSFEHLGYLNRSSFASASNPELRTSDLPVSSASGREKPAKSTVECCDYAYWTEVKHAGGIVQALDARLSPSEPIADYLVIGTLLLDAEGNPIRATEDDLVSPAIWFEHVDSTSWNTAQCGGWLLTFITQAEATSIRHIIVVHPHEVQVPFVLTDLPLPSF